MKRRASPGFLSMPAARRISGRVGQALFLVIVLSPLSSCAEKVSFYQDAFEMNQVRITGESAEQAARDSEQASVRLAEQNAELRKVLERLSREVEKTEQEAEQCRARMERLGVKVSGSSPSPTGSEEKKGPR